MSTNSICITMGWLGTLIRRRQRRQEALDQILRAHRPKDRGRREVNVDYGVEMEPVEGAAVGKKARFRLASDAGDTKSRINSEEKTGLISQTSILANKHMPEPITEEAGHWYPLPLDERGHELEFVRALPEDVYSVALMTRIHRKRVAVVCGCAWLIGFVGLLLVRPASAPAPTVFRRPRRTCRAMLCSRSKNSYDEVYNCRSLLPGRCE